MLKRFSEDRGQVIVLVAIGITALMGIAALVVDLGYAWAAQRNLQSSADAAALAGAEGLPDLDSAVSFAQQYGTTGNNTHTDLGQVAESVSTTCVEQAGACPHDAVVVNEIAHPETFFARVLGVHLFTINVKSVACRDPLSGKALLVSTAYSGSACASLPNASEVTGVTTPTTTDTTTTTTTTTPDTTTTSPATTTTTPDTTTTSPATTTTPTTTTAPTTTTTPVTTTTPTTTTTATTTTTPGVATTVLGETLSATQISVGHSVIDTGTLTGATSGAGGTVTYTVFSDSNCSQNAVTAGTKTVDHAFVPSSNSLAFTKTGAFFWNARYTGDAQNKPSLAPCTGITVHATTTGALTIGYWQNKNGQAIVTGGASVSGVCKSATWLRTYTPFKDLNSKSSCAAVGTYVLNVINAADASGTAMNAMLKAQMLASALDVYFSDPSLGGNVIGAPLPVGSITVGLTNVCAPAGYCGWSFVDASSAFGGASKLTVSQALTYAASKSTMGGNTWYNNDKSVQELAKDVFDAVNNEVIFTA